MKEIILLCIFLTALGYISIKIIRRIFSEAAPEKQIKETQTDNYDPYENFIPSPRPVYTPKRKSSLPGLVFIALMGFLIYQNYPLIIDKLNIQSHVTKQQELNAKARRINQLGQLAALPSLKITDQKKVDGVFWFKISGSTENGQIIDGWVTEFSLKKEPAKQSKTIDSISKKLGLPTTEERVNYIKKLKKINSALDTALGKDKRNN
ncbi:MAG: hypothetical protein ACQETH_00485 [Candidatus Rifleibacteriota bacterium]